jgi:hypothetical protein
VTTGTESAAVKALRYAENSLKVHEVYTQALVSRDNLDKTLTDLSEVKDKKRDIEIRLQDVELEVASEERGKHPDMSQAQMDKHLKMKLHDNTDARGYREQLVKIVSDLDGLEFDKTMHETDIKIAVSRMQELAGYLQYLAAIKQSEIARLASETLREESSK